MLFPMIPTWNEKPPTLYSLLESIVNFGTDDKTKIKDLAKEGRGTIFNFNYPLSAKVSKEDFECMILNHFIMRRIGFETVTAFRIQLNVRLNEIMGNYNKMFDMLDGWDIFNDGETTTRQVTDERNITTTSESSNDTITSTTSETTNTAENSSETSATNISDNRNSDTPQNRLSEVQSGEYVDNYQYKNDNNSAEDSSSSEAHSTNQSDTTNNNLTSSEDNTENRGTTREVTTRTQSDRLKLYQEFIENRKNIYTMIFRDLEDLFYQLV